MRYVNDVLLTTTTLSRWPSTSPFQQDYARLYIVCRTMVFIQEADLSPDLNPIENV